MPGIAVNIEPFVKNLFAEFRLPTGSGIRTAAYGGAARVKAEANPIIRRLGLADDGISSRIERARISRRDCPLDGLASDARGVQLRHVKMIAQEIARAAAVRRSRRH